MCDYNTGERQAWLATIKPPRDWGPVREDWAPYFRALAAAAQDRKEFREALLTGSVFLALIAFLLYVFPVGMVALFGAR